MSEHSMMVDALIYLSAAVVCVPLMSALRLGSVLGYLLAGCLIGPSLLGFVRDVHAIMHVAELGVVLMLFVIGLELDPKRLWEMRAKVFGGGALQLVACTALLFAGALVVGLSWRAALIAALSLSTRRSAVPRLVCSCSKTSLPSRSWAWSRSSRRARARAKRALWPQARASWRSSWWSARGAI
jgi:glutathione-regulated potassium-efflux system ancillary protein KefC